MVWLCGPPSDHDVKKYVDLLNVCGDGALTEFAAPTITVTENGVVRGASLTTRSLSTRPPGLVLNVSTTVFGSNRTLVVDVSPPESVAVSWTSSQHGYSWSGAVNDPLETPETVWIRCVWQSVGVKQWCRISDHVRSDAGSVPSCASVACPENGIASPTFHVSVDAGESMTAVGAVLPTVMVTDAVSVAPWSSVT